ncbi:MAG TPA: ribbon-helix-helix protein, CopG family [Terriglobales bacterium]|nr:ribbon-helix-helix protein, CopG family [Terriglobales bacterium]
MATSKVKSKIIPVRRSVSLRPELANKVKQLARRANRSTSRVIEELIEAGLENREAEKRRFFLLAERLAASTDQREQQRIKDELAHMTFGE